MKRLSLKRNRPSNLSNNAPDWSDDSFDPLPDVQENTEHQKYTNQVNHETSDISHNLTDATTSRYTSNAAGSKTLELTHDISDDSSNDDDIIIIEEKPSTSGGKQSMFNWGKTYSARKPTYRGNVSSKKCNMFDSRPGRKTFTQLYKRKKTMNETTNWDDEELASLNDSEDILSPEVIVQRETMIAGIKVKFPAEPYPCQMAVMNRVSKMWLHDQFSLSFYYDCTNYIYSYICYYITLIFTFNYIENCIYSSLVGVTRRRTVSWRALLGAVRLWRFCVAFWHGKSTTGVSLPHTLSQCLLDYKSFVYHAVFLNGFTTINYCYIP